MAVQCNSLKAEIKWKLIRQVRCWNHCYISFLYEIGRTAIILMVFCFAGSWPRSFYYSLGVYYPWLLDLFLILVVTLFLFLHLFTYLVHGGGCWLHIWRSENNLWEFFFYYVGPGNWTQAARLDGRRLYLLAILLISHLQQTFLHFFL